MISKKTNQTDKQDELIQLVDGEFTPEQASGVILPLINQKINFHKLEHLQLWEKNHNYDQGPIMKRIKELEEALIDASNFIEKMKNQGKNLKLNGTIKMTSLER